MGNANSQERTTTLSRDAYFFITPDVQDRLRLAEKRQQVSVGSESSAQSPPPSASAARPQSSSSVAGGGSGGGPSLSDSVADSIRQTKMMEQLQQEYEARLAQLEESSNQRFQSAAGQFSAAVNQVEAKFLDRGAPPPCCQAEKEAMTRCYAANGRYPLRCSQLVEAFEQCVTEQRRAFVLRQQQAGSGS